MNYSKILLTRQDVEKLYTARELLDKKYSQHITIGDLSKKTGLNRKKLTYGFKLLFASGVYEYQVRLRMQKAKLDLSQTDKPIKLIAQQAGYNSSSTFSISFKRNTGCTPREWRNTHGENPGNILR